MTAFTDFAENTKDISLMMCLGLAFLLVACLTRNVIGNVGRLVQLVATLVLGYVTYLFFKNIQALFKVFPDALFAPEHALYKHNIIAVWFVCIILFALVLYSIYTVFF